MRWIVRLLRNEDGPTAVEYAVMLVLIVVVCLSAIGLVGTYLNTSFQTSADKLSQASST